MSNLTAKQIIKREYGESKNIITPEVIRYGKINKNLAYEISSGIGMKGDTIYGVSIVEIDKDGKTTRRTDLSDLFDSIDEVEMYIEVLKEEYKIQ